MKKFLKEWGFLIAALVATILTVFAIAPYWNSLPIWEKVTIPIVLVAMISIAAGKSKY